MWVRQCDVDAESEAALPIPSRIASNEEFIPPPQTPQQKEYEARVVAIADRESRRRGISRRDFLRTGCGMAAALTALNEVYGWVYEVSAAEVAEPGAFDERWPKDGFIFDVQTHHVDLSQKWYDTTPDGALAVKFFMSVGRGKPLGETLDRLTRAHYVKEVFGDSDTTMAIISGVPSRTWEQNPLPPDMMAATRDYVNGIAGSQRVLSHGILRPNLGGKELDEMERQVKDLKISAWKMYTGAELGGQFWRMDDEKVAYPCWEKTRKLGIKNLCVHKGLPLGLFNVEGCKPLDLEKAAKDFPDLNFIAYHSGFRGGRSEMAQGLGKNVPDPKTNDPQEIPWFSDIVRILKRNPDIKNIYFELGGTFAYLSAAAPDVCLHLLGQAMQVAGPDHILWGTDSIWNGSPQSQIVRLRKMKMKDEYMEKYKYPDLTDEVKNRILGLNAAKLFNLDVKAKREAIKTDKLTQLREESRRNPTPSNTQYGWLWVGEGEPPPGPVGDVG
jgi:predicted TIM-barrel fold metal-dependent hydrolase